VALIRDDVAELPNVYIEAGEVRLNLIPVIAEALRLVVQDAGDLLPDISLPGTVADLRSRDANRSRLPCGPSCPTTSGS
jgi:hypothetical protein